MGCAYYGDDGIEKAQVPYDEHDLAEVKRHTNNAMRMFLSDSPTNGWRWARVVNSMSLWASVGTASTRTVTGGSYDVQNDQTLLTANTASFFESMEEKSIVVTGQGTFVIKQYVSSTQIYVYGSHPFSAASTYSITADGDYTMPRSFVGAFTGTLTFGAATNRAVAINWVDEGTVRQMRENVTVGTGIPRYLAMSNFVGQQTRRRYKLMSYPIPYQDFSVQFPYDLSFQLMSATTEGLVTPVIHDETIRAAVLAVVARDVDKAENSVEMGYYQKCLGQSVAADGRSAPRKLGYFGNDRSVVTPRNFREFMKRPGVVYNTP